MKGEAMSVSINRVIFNILAKDVGTSAAFYQQLAGFEVVGQADWYVTLTSPSMPGFELGLIDQVSEFVPRAARGTVGGLYLTLLVPDVAAAVELARGMDVEIVEEPTIVAEGWSRAVLRDPNGVVIDLSTEAAQLTLPPRHAVG
jgi:catechol 2,3-dioxygenase-like lactoylglutathione lyase family enzyme